MKGILFFVVLFSSTIIFAQVGINTTEPSPASVLDVNSSSDGENFGGFMLPRVTVAQRDAIPVTMDDAGLVVYINDGSIKELQVWNGDGWVTAFPKTLEQNALIAAWEVGGLPGGTSNYGPSPFDASESNIGVTIGGLTRGSGVGSTTGSGAANAWGGNVWASGFPDVGDETQQTAEANNKFITFSISPNSGVTLSLSLIEQYNIRRSGTGPTTGIWQYSINGGVFVDIGTPITWGGTTTATGNPQAAIDLSGIPALQNLTSATTVTFRIVNWGTNNGAGTWYINNTPIPGNDLIIRGKIIQ
jgi:hypothetical protein